MCSITIRPADKGSGQVVMDTDKYVAEINRQIEDVEIYEKLTGDPTKKFQVELFRIISDAEEDKLIDVELVPFFTGTVSCGAPDIRSPQNTYEFDRTTDPTPLPPGKPIVSGRVSLFNNVAILQWEWGHISRTPQIL